LAWIGLSRLRALCPGARAPLSVRTSQAGREAAALCLRFSSKISSIEMALYFKTFLIHLSLHLVEYWAWLLSPAAPCFRIETPSQHSMRVMEGGGTEAPRPHEEGH
jgi:hypothetical protein